MTEFKPHIFDSGLSGPNLLITGAVHGNETCGPKAIWRLIDEFNRAVDPLSLSRGTLTVIPVCNPIAYKAGKRHVDGDLNRNLMPVDEPKTELDQIRNQLCSELRRCDVLIDLHSLYCSQLPFVYVGPYNMKERQLAASLGIRHMIEGWENAYQKSNFDVPHSQSIGTTEYARLNGAYGVTVECGNHDDPNAPYVGFRAALGALNFLHMIDNPPDRIEKILEETVINHDDIICGKMDRVYYQLKDGRMHESNRQNFDAIAVGDVLAVNDDGTKIRAEQDGYIIMPDPRMTKGPQKGEMPEEWFYTAVPSRLFP